MIAPHIAIEALAAVLVERNVDFRFGPAGGLQLRDTDHRLGPNDWVVIRSKADGLKHWLINASVEDLQPRPVTEGVCDRCRCPEFNDVPIHEGESVRRDCKRCGRTLGFPVWYGERDETLTPPVIRRAA